MNVSSYTWYRYLITFLYIRRILFLALEPLCWFKASHNSFCCFILHTSVFCQGPYFVCDWNQNRDWKIPNKLIVYFISLFQLSDLELILSERIFPFVIRRFPFQLFMKYGLNIRFQFQFRLNETGLFSELIKQNTRQNFCFKSIWGKECQQPAIQGSYIVCNKCVFVS